MKPSKSIVIFLLATIAFSVNAQKTLIWSEEFENGWGDWWSDEGIWELGTPSVWPDSAYSGNNLVGTYLSGNYPYGPDSRLISPTIELPTIGEDEEILLRFQQIFNYSSADRGYVQIQAYDAETKEWSDWSDLDSFRAFISRWHNARVLLSEYSGKIIRLGFFHKDATEDPDGIVHHYESFGWYLDNFSIAKQKIPIFSGHENFDNGPGGWYSEDGIWEIGSPSVGPDTAFSGSNLMGTVLDGNYLYGPDSRLVSPRIIVPDISSNEEVLLRFQHYFSYASSDRGHVQIQRFNPVDNAWSEWTTLYSYKSFIISWHYAGIDLSDYAGETIRIGFLHTDVTEDPSGIVHHSESAGWYVDDIEVFKQTIPFVTSYDNFDIDPDKWISNNGIWQAGIPTSGPEKAYSGDNVYGTNLSGKYLYGPDSRLVSPRIYLPEISNDEEIELRFQQFFNYASSDYGKVQVQVMNDTTKEWSDWIDLDIFRRYITNWHHAKIDLSGYAGNTIRIGLFHSDVTEDPEGIVHHSESTGWYIDDFTIQKKRIPYFTGFEDFEESYNGWFSQDGIWEIGTPATQPDSAYSGDNLAGTVLSGKYLYGPDSRLVSPRIVLQEEPQFGEIILRYQQYHNFASADYGDVQIQTLNPKTNEWSEWTTIKHTTSHVPDWHHARIDISEHAGDTVRIGFFHVDNTEDPDGIVHHSESIGWFIDDISITGVSSPFVVDAGQNTSLCFGEEIILGGLPTISNLEDNQRIAWDASEYIDDTTKLNPSAIPLETSTFSVHLIEGDKVLATDEITVEILEKPQADAGKDDVICSGESAILGGNPTGSGGTPPYTYQWEPSDDVGENNLPNPEVLPAQEESEYILGVTDSNGCADKDTVLIFTESASITLSEPDTINAGETTAFKIFGNIDNLLVTIDPEPDGQQYFNDKIVVEDTPLETTSYSITATTKVALCSSSKMITIVVLPTSVSPDHFESINVYPVPAQDRLNISSSTVGLTELEIITLKGGIVFQTKIESSPAIIDISSLPSGIYIIQLKSVDKSYKTRFIKK